jgi:hypothetical protein
MLEWMDNLKKSADDLKEKKARAVVKVQRLRCLGLASGDPDHLEFYAIEAALDPGLVQDVLDTDDGARLGLIMEGQLRSSGELDQVRTSWVMPDVFALLKTSIAAKSLSDSVAIKLIETLGKQNGRGGEKRTSLAAPFVGSATDLIAWLTDSAPFHGSLPFTQPQGR